MKGFFVIISALFFVLCVGSTVVFWGGLYGCWGLLNSIIWGFNLFMNLKGYYE